MRLKLSLLFLLCLTATTSFALDRRNRLGIGFSDQLNGMNSISFKIQKSRSIAFEVLGHINAEDDESKGIGTKIFKNIFDEPNLNFYLAVLGGMVSEKREMKRDSGFQFDFTAGSEFSIPGLQSIGLSFDVGVSISTLDDIKINSTSSRFVIGAIHFYL